MIDYCDSIESYLERLFPLTRSITGEGNRQSFEILKEIIPLKILNIPSHEAVYDWTIPQEWNIRNAWIKDGSGRKIIDFRNSNLHVVSYSLPIHKKMGLTELKNHLHFLPDLPGAIPYRTTYYDKNWGFCLSYNDFLKSFSNGEIYEVFIDSDFKDGSLNIGELVIKGKIDREILISTYICHPSMANDNLSGIILTAFLAKELLKKDLNYSYRVVFVPETIGAIAYCAKNESILKKIDTGFVIATVGGEGTYGYKQSYDNTHSINSIVEEVFKDNNISFITYPFSPNGSDERQYSSQGFRINTVSITKDKYYEYDLYHTSLDNLDFINSKSINKSLNIYIQAIEKLDKNIVYKNLIPNCEPKLDKYGLYPKIGGSQIPKDIRHNELEIVRWLLFCCDGKTPLYSISNQLNQSIEDIYRIASKLEEKCLLQKID
jgi:aminopeptidase-like protein